MVMPSVGCGSEVAGGVAADAEEGTPVNRLIMLVVALCSLTLVRSPLALAQEGVAFEPLAQEGVEELPSTPADIFFARFTLEPGAGFRFDPNDPALALVYVESGVFTFRAVTDVRVTRVVVGGTPVAGEVAVGGVQVELSPGDSALFPPFVAGEARNAGTEPVILLVAGIEPTGAAAAATPLVGTPEAVGTPLVEDEEVPGGLSFQGLAIGRVDELPAGPALIGFRRLTLEPGASLPPVPTLGPAFGVVEEGTASFTVSEGQVEILRGIAMATPGVEELESELVGVGEEVTLEAGDGVFYQAGTVTDLRNEGNAPLKLLAGSIEALTA